MPDFSLLFFGAIILIFLIYVVIKIIKSQNIKESIFNIFILDSIKLFYCICNLLRQYW